MSSRDRTNQTSTEGELPSKYDCPGSRHVDGLLGLRRRFSSTSTPLPTPSPSISVTVTPNATILSPDTTQSFTATVTGTTNTAVTWSVQESVGGTIDSTGLYTPPQNSSGTFHVVATSQANPAFMGIAAVTVQLPQLAISPAAVTLPPNGTQTFTASAVGFANNNVTWAVQESAGGVINGAGLYTAPSAGGVYHVVATSMEETTVTASATVIVTAFSSGFTPTGSLHEARGLHTATLLPDNKVLVAYGSNSSGVQHCNRLRGPLVDRGVRLWHGHFTEIVGDSGAGIYGHTATLLPNGKVLLAGGFVNSIWDYYGISDFRQRGNTLRLGQWCIQRDGQHDGQPRGSYSDFAGERQSPDCRRG